MTEKPPITHIVLVMPAYNEAGVIGELLEQAAVALTGEGIAWNVVVVDDGSTDATGEIVTRAAQSHREIVLAPHETNRGLGPAIVTGLRKASELAQGDGALIVCMDADLTHPPDVIPSMRAEADRGADLIIASRFQPESVVVGLSPFRRLLSWGAHQVFTRLLALRGVRDYACGFRAFRASLITDGFKRFGPDGLVTRRGFACTDELLIKLALLNPDIREVPFTLRYDLKQGKSKLPLVVTILETLRLIRWARRELKKKSGAPSEEGQRNS